MPATPWTELTANETAWQEGTSGTSGSSGTVDFIWGAFALTQPEFVADAPTTWTELTAPSTAGTELTAPSTAWTEVIV